MKILDKFVSENGTDIQLEDLADHFSDGDEVKWYFGMDVEYQGW